MKSYLDCLDLEEKLIHTRCTRTALIHFMKCYLLEKEELTNKLIKKLDNTILVDRDEDWDGDDYFSFNLELSFGDAYIDIYVLPTYEYMDDEVVYYVTEVGVEGENWKVDEEDEEDV